MAIVLHDGLCGPPDYRSAMSAFHDTTRLVGLPLRGVRVFGQFSWLKAGSVKVALPRPAHQRVPLTTLGVLRKRKPLGRLWQK
jgi:hypothetical protein